MELYSDLVLAVIYFKFNIHTEYTLFQSIIEVNQAVSGLSCNRQNSTPFFCYVPPLYDEIGDFG